MILKNFCLIVIENTEGIQTDIIKIAEGNPRLLSTPTFAIATFSSAFTVNEIKELFINNNRSVIVFELIDNGYSAFLNNDQKHDFVFGHIEEFGKEIVQDITNKLMKEYLLDSKTKLDNSVTHKERPAKKNIDIDKLTPEEKESMVDNLLDKGYKNLSEEDKELIRKLKE